MHERDKTLYNSNRDKENTDLRDKYKNQRNAVTSTVRQVKANYFCNKIDEYKDNPKLLWKHFKTLGTCAPSFFSSPISPPLA